MKNLITKLLYLTILSTFIFLNSCDDEDVEDKIRTTINFENVDLNESGIYTAKEAGGYIFVDGVDFYATYDSEYDFSSGIAISNHTNTDSAGYTNQYSVYAGVGANGSSKFAIANTPEQTTDSIITFPYPVLPISIQITNTTYSALSMANGDQFAKKFTSEDQDYYSITIHGFNDGVETGTIMVYLADYREGSNTGILSTWQNVNLSSLGEVTSIGISYQSTDVGSYGINTPRYFAFDDLIFEY